MIVQGSQENNKFIFQALEMSLKLIKSGNVLGKHIAYEKLHLEQKACE